MNIYIVVEGRCEKSVYREWIPLINPVLKYTETIPEVENNNFYIIAGGGYPGYLKIIEDAILDVNEQENENGQSLFDRLIIGVDSEELSLQEKRDELTQYVKKILKREKAKIDYQLVIQHFCFETWCLGNRRILGKNIKNE